MTAGDRFRIYTFSTASDELTSGFVDATKENVDRYSGRVAALTSGGSTNLYDGLERALGGLDADRATSLVLLTDAVTNTGIVAPKDFENLVQKHDIRFFGFLLGNSTNWPLMQVLTDTTGGFYKTVSNADDILGQVILAGDKLTHESLHHVEFEIDGVGAVDMTDVPKKLYYGQQLVVFGRYTKPGTAKLHMKARITGRDEVYETTATFPETAVDDPELERLWALAKIDKLTVDRSLGRMDAGEVTSAVRDLGLQYQLVTDETSMVVLSDQLFQKHNIKRRNVDRVQREHAAQQRRASRPAPQHRVDRKRPTFPASAPRSGGGAVHPVFILLGAGVLASLCIRRRRKR